VPDALTLWSLAVLVIGGLMYAAMSMSTRSAPSTPSPVAVRRPGWIARRRARSGIRPTKPGAAIGYASATRRVVLSPCELSLGVLILGTPGSGKTYAAVVLIEALAWRGNACVLLDPKPSLDWLDCSVAAAYAVGNRLPRATSRCRRGCLRGGCGARQHQWCASLWYRLGLRPGHNRILSESVRAALEVVLFGEAGGQACAVR
jgi:hypothetical protein